MFSIDFIEDEVGSDGYVGVGINCDDAISDDFVPFITLNPLFFRQN